MNDISSESVTPAALAPAKKPASPTSTLLILSNKKGETTVINLDITSMPEIPKGWEWAKTPLTHLIAGFKTVRENERKIIGTNAIFEGYKNEGGLFMLTENGTYKGRPVPGHSDYVQLPAGDKMYPTIVFDAQSINSVPKNAAFYAAHELGHHYNNVIGALRAYTPEQLWQYRESVLMHSPRPLFGFSANLDFFSSDRKGKRSETLQVFTETRLRDNPILSDQLERESEMLADAVGNVLSDVHPKFDPEFNRKVKPLNSPLIKRYVEDVFMLDVLMRGSPSPNIAKIDALHMQLADPKRILGDEASFRYVGDVEERLVQQQPVSDKELEKARNILQKSLDNFQKQRKALVPSQHSALEGNPLEEDVSQLVASLQADKEHARQKQDAVTQMQQIANAQPQNGVATTQPVVKTANAKITPS